VSDIPNLGYSTFLGLSKRDFHTLGSWIGSLRDRLGTGYLDIMGSGYDEAAIPTCWLSLLTGTLDIPFEVEDESLPKQVDDPERIAATQAVAERLSEILSPYWSSLSA